MRLAGAAAIDLKSPAVASTKESIGLYDYFRGVGLDCDINPMIFIHGNIGNILINQSHVLYDDLR